MTFLIIFGAQILFLVPKVRFFKLSLLLIFSILEEPELTFTFYYLENENDSGFGFDIYDFCL